MKKGLKKQVEMELAEAIEKLLSRHNKKAISKTKKAVKNAAKSVAKKFSKITKSLEEKKTVRKRRKSSASKTKDAARTKRPYHRKAPVVTNGLNDIPGSGTELSASLQPEMHS